MTLCYTLVSWPWEWVGISEGLLQANVNLDWHKIPKALKCCSFVWSIYALCYAFLLSIRPWAWHGDFYCCFKLTFSSPCISLPPKFFIDPLLIINSFCTFVLIFSVWVYCECCASQEHTIQTLFWLLCLDEYVTPSCDHIHNLTPAHVLQVCLKITFVKCFEGY